MEQRSVGNVVILVPDAGTSAADFEAALCRLIADGYRHLVINFERAPRPWDQLPGVLDSIVKLYFKRGRGIAFCGARPPDAPGVIRESLRLHFDSESDAVSWLQSRTTAT